MEVYFFNRAKRSMHHVAALFGPPDAAIPFVTFRISDPAALPEIQAIMGRIAGRHAWFTTEDKQLLADAPVRGR